MRTHQRPVRLTALPYRSINHGHRRPQRSTTKPQTPFRPAAPRVRSDPERRIGRNITLAQHARDAGVFGESGADGMQLQKMKDRSYLGKVIFYDQVTDLL
jgi:hypothetical protein